MKLTIKFVATAFVLAVTSNFWAQALRAEPNQQVTFSRHENSLAVSIGGQAMATFCFKDAAISRPYFTHVTTNSGIEVTRRYPPVDGKDLTDHATFHPGIWLAFGDLGGADSWRLKARIRHAAFIDEPSGNLGQGSFTVRNEYLDATDAAKVICSETARYTILTRPIGYLLLWDSRFSSDHDFYFGDQEEMGLGIRVATPLRASKAVAGDVPPGNGLILDSNGRKNEPQIWGNTANWCDYSGTLANKSVGITILCHPANMRPSWFHARDYGLLVANLFGRKSFGKGDASRIAVRAGQEFRLRYGIFVHESPPNEQINFDREYEDYLRLSGN